MNESASFYDLFTSGIYAPYMRSVTIAGKTPLTIATAEQPAGEFPDPPMAEFSLQVKLRGASSLDFGLAGERTRYACPPGTLTLSPPNVDAYYALDKPFRLGIIAFPASAFQRFMAQAEKPLASDFGELHSRTFHDPFLEQLLHRMMWEADHGGPSGDLFVDSALNTLLSALVGLCDRKRMEDASQQGLSKHELAMVCDLIEARLEDNPNLDEIAGLTNLSEAQFIKAFKQAIGLTPYQYQLERRVQKARELIAEGKQSLVDVAYTCGFASQQHMTGVFKKRLGMTPSQYRKEIAR